MDKETFEEDESPDIEKMGYGPEPALDGEEYDETQEADDEQLGES
jgi:hypothetical protein